MTLVDVAILGFEGDLLTSSCELKRGKCFVVVAGAGADCAHYRDFCLVVQGVRQHPRQFRAPIRYVLSGAAG